MKSVALAEAKAQLSALVDAVEAGETSASRAMANLWPR